MVTRSSPSRHESLLYWTWSLQKVSRRQFFCLCLHICSCCFPCYIFQCFILLAAYIIEGDFRHARWFGWSHCPDNKPHWILGSLDNLHCFVMRSVTKIMAINLTGIEWVGLGCAIHQTTLAVSQTKSKLLTSKIWSPVANVPKRAAGLDSNTCLIKIPLRPRPWGPTLPPIILIPRPLSGSRLSSTTRTPGSS